MKKIRKYKKSNKKNVEAIKPSEKKLGNLKKIREARKPFGKNQEAKKP